MATSPSIGSNNPFRHSFGASEPESPTTSNSLCPPSQPLQRTTSSTTTIMEEDENELTYSQPITMRRTNSACEPPPTPPPNGPLPQLPTAPQNAYILDGPKNSKRVAGEGNGDGHILITIHSRDSQASSPSPPQTAGPPPTHKMSMDASQQNCNMWPAIRFTQKARFKSKRRWIALKVGIAVVIVIGAVAIGLGISKAVNDGKNK
ncbi:hypothetical protein DFH27DRAFT_608277 [Peziza echinospora]|nr:hypothetical protein DFH27DRAFT_608277 [Peziza echinospora]